MTKIIENAHTDLISLDAEAEMCNAPTIVAIERKMAPNMRQDWAEKVGGKALSSRQKFMMMMEFINKWRNKLEYLEDISNVAPEVKGMSCHTNEETSDQRNTKRENCWIHRFEGFSGGHPIWTCKEFLSKSVDERLKLVEKHKACKVCLLTFCPAVENPDTCKSRFRCRTDGCKENHSRLLHKKADMSGVSAHVGANSEPGSTLLQLQGL